METKKKRSYIRRSLGLGMAAMVVSTAVAEPQAKPVSLDDCVKMALQKNLDLRIIQYAPRNAQSVLSQTYQAYDPTLTAQANQQFNFSAGVAPVGSFVPPTTETWNENYSVGVGGLLPTGLTYDLGTTMRRNSGIAYRPVFDAAGNAVIDPATGKQLILQDDQGFRYFPNASIRLSQPLLRNFWIDQPRMMIQINKLNVERQEEAVRQEVMRVTTEVALTYHDVIATRESVRVQRKAVETAERRLLEQKKRVEVGALAPLDEKQSEAEVYRAKADLIQAQGRYGDALTALRNLVSDNLAEVDEVILDPTLALTAEPVAFSKTDSWHKALTLRPDIMNAQHTLEQQSVRLKFARNQIFPQLDLTGGYGISGVGLDFGPSLKTMEDRTYPNHNAGIVFSIPLSNRNAREAHKQAKLEQERLLLDYKRLEQNAMRLVDVSIRAAKTQFERVGATKKQREFAAQALDAEEKKLANGKSTAFQVLELQRQLTQAESDEINAFSEYNKELYRLSQAEGDILNKLGILLDIR